MKKILTIFFMIINLFAFGQTYIPFPTTNTTWCSDFITQGFIPPWNTIYHNYYFYKTNGDTIINSKTYTVISNYAEISNNGHSSSYCYIREDSNKVFCKYNLNSLQDTSEFVLYNFNFHIGDTVLLPILAGNSLSHYEATIVTEDSILIGTKYHRRIGINSWIPFDFIEGVGCAQGLLYQEIPWVDWWGELYCFSMNDTIFSINGTGYTSTGNCYQYIGINDNNVDYSKVIYPNPTSGKVFINIDKFAKYELYNNIGQVILSTSVPFIDLYNYPNGIYFIKIIDISRDRTVVQKIIKE